MTELPQASEIKEKKRGPGRPRKSPQGSAFSEKERKARFKLENLKGDLEKILFRQIRALEWAQEALVRSMTRGAAAGQTFLAKEDANQLVSLNTALEKLVETQTKYLKGQKELGGNLTEGELEERAVRRIMGIEDTARRRDILRKMVEEHHAGRQPGSFEMRAPAVKALLDPSSSATEAIAELLK